MNGEGFQGIDAANLPCEAGEGDHEVVEGAMGLSAAYPPSKAFRRSRLSAGHSFAMS